MKRILYILLIFIGIAVLILAATREAESSIYISPESAVIEPELILPPEEPEKPVGANFKMLGTFLVTGYNTVQAQTDSSPCIAASGENICGRRDVVACPRSLPFGTEIRIEGSTYICLDRLAIRFDNRFDISCDKDFECPAEVSGYKTVEISN